MGAVSAGNEEEEECIQERTKNETRCLVTVLKAFGVAVCKRGIYNPTLAAAAAKVAVGVDV